MRKYENVSLSSIVMNYVNWKYEICIGSWCIMKIFAMWKSFYLDIHVYGMQTTFSQIKEFPSMWHLVSITTNTSYKGQKIRKFILFTFKFYYGGLIWVLINRVFVLDCLWFYVSVSICLCVLKNSMLTRAYLIPCNHSKDRTNFVHLNYLFYKFQSPKANVE